ncbi:hypothetical protein N0V82_006566 [Gnomoniopsis sp. IMI 355080]|nr:hypothetical protein N0V82_006566 [Gnomoniopsis sp. IMI 355080]
MRTDKTLEEIARYIGDLNDLLYDFEDFIDADNFDAEKFLELQACSRKAAPGISHRIARLKLLPGADENPTSPSSTARPFDPTTMVRQPSGEVSLQHGQSLSDPDDTNRERQAEDSMPWPTGRDFEAWEIESPVLGYLQPVQEEVSSPRPRPSLESWSQRSQDIEQGLQLIAQRREHSSYSDSAIGSEANSEDTYSPSITGQSKASLPPVPPKSPYRMITPLTQGPTFEQTASFIRSHYGRGSISPISPRHNRDSLASFVIISLQSSASDHRSCEWDSYFSGVIPISTTHRRSQDSSESQFQELDQGRSKSPHTNASAITTHVTEALETLEHPAPGMIPDGLILVEEIANQPVCPVATLEMQLGGCAMSLHSSYYQFGGFCTGAIEIIRGGLGIKHIKKQGLAVGNIEVAKCKACAYELEWKAVEQDLNNEGMPIAS